MPDFQYTAREATGQQVTGVLTASSRQEALSHLSTRQLFPMKVDIAEETKSLTRGGFRRVNPRHLATFYTQLADLLKSGVPLLRSLELLEKQSGNHILRLTIQDVREHVAEGTRLAEAMRLHPKVFSELAISMVRAGEEGSFMEDVLKRIAVFTEHQQELKSKATGAMAYPLFLLVVGGLIVMGMMIFFVPKFEPIFSRLREKGGLPWATDALMAMSAFFKDYWYLVVGGIAAAIFGLHSWFNSEEGRVRLDTIRLRTPGFGRIIKSLAISRFCRILGTLLANGVPIIQSLSIAKDATGNVVLSTAIANAAENITAGKNLAQPLGTSGEFPEEVVEMISVGEEANNLEQVLIDIAEAMERRTNRYLDMFVRFLEPVLLTFMAGIVLFVVIALMYPILKSSSAL